LISGCWRERSIPEQVEDEMADYVVRAETVGARTLAAVRARTRIGEIGRAFKAPLDEVWAFLKRNAQIKPGHNVFLYHHPPRRGDPLDVDFGVEVAGAIAGEVPVRCVATPAGEAAVTTHIGPYSCMQGAHDAVHAWCGAAGREIGAVSWEVYGDWSDDETKLETRIFYLLR
jgi:effector-binding domain-containing protein